MKDTFNLCVFQAYRFGIHGYTLTMIYTLNVATGNLVQSELSFDTLTLAFLQKFVWWFRDVLYSQVPTQANRAYHLWLSKPRQLYPPNSSTNDV